MKRLYLDVGITVDEAVKGSSDIKAYRLFSAGSSRSVIATMNLASQQKKEIHTTSYWEEQGFTGEQMF